MNNNISSDELYKEYMRKVGDRTELFALLRNEFNINSALYPGSHIDITPSFFYRRTAYIDNYKNAQKFFSKPDLRNYIIKNKLYEEDPILDFFFKDYRNYVSDLENNFDLLISLYAGIVSKYCKQYLRKEGLFIVNNSHGDASMADLDPDLSLNGVLYRSNKKLYYTQRNLDKYFKPKKDSKITKELIEKTMKGIGYTKTATYYLFIKIN